MESLEADLGPQARTSVETICDEEELENVVGEDQIVASGEVLPSQSKSSADVEANPVIVCSQDGQQINIHCSELDNESSLLEQLTPEIVNSISNVTEMSPVKRRDAEENSEVILESFSERADGDCAAASKSCETDCSDDHLSHGETIVVSKDQFKSAASSEGSILSQKTVDESPILPSDDRLSHIEAIVVSKDELKDAASSEGSSLSKEAVVDESPLVSSDLSQEINNSFQESNGSSQETIVTLQVASSVLQKAIDSLQEDGDSMQQKAGVSLHSGSVSSRESSPEVRVSSQDTSASLQGTSVQTEDTALGENVVKETVLSCGLDLACDNDSEDTMLEDLTDVKSSCLAELNTSSGRDRRTITKQKKRRRISDKVSYTCDKFPTASFVKPEWLKPFEDGWCREVVLRKEVVTSGVRNADIYYYAPSGKKLRSMPEIINHLKENEYSLDTNCFTFSKYAIYKEPFETVRSAGEPGGKSAHSSPLLRSALALGRSPSSSQPPVKKKLKIVAASSSTENSRKKDLTNLPKKRPMLVEGSQRTGPDAKRSKLVEKNVPPEVVQKLCGLNCPGSEGVAPTIPCDNCMCMFHSTCIRFSANSSSFTCQNCQKQQKSSKAAALVPSCVAPLGIPSLRRITQHTTTITTKQRPTIRGPPPLQRANMISQAPPPPALVLAPTAVPPMILPMHLLRPFCVTTPTYQPMHSAISSSGLSVVGSLAATGALLQPSTILSQPSRQLRLVLPPKVVTQLNLNKPLALKINGQQLLLHPNEFIPMANGIKVLLPENLIAKSQPIAHPVSMGVNGTSRPNKSIAPTHVGSAADKDEVCIIEPEPSLPPTLALPPNFAAKSSSVTTVPLTVEKSKAPTHGSAVDKGEVCIIEPEPSIPSTLALPSTLTLPPTLAAKSSNVTTVPLTVEKSKAPTHGSAVNKGEVCIIEPEPSIPPTLALPPTLAAKSSSVTTVPLTVEKSKVPTHGSAADKGEVCIIEPEPSIPPTLALPPTLAAKSSSVTTVPLTVEKSKVPTHGSAADKGEVCIIEPEPSIPPTLALPPTLAAKSSSVTTVPLTVEKSVEKLNGKSSAPHVTDTSAVQQPSEAAPDKCHSRDVASLNVLSLGAGGETVGTGGETVLETVGAGGETVLEAVDAGGETVLETVDAGGETVLETVDAGGETVLETVGAGGETVLKMAQQMSPMQVPSEPEGTNSVVRDSDVAAASAVESHPVVIRVDSDTDSDPESPLPCEPPVDVPTVDSSASSVVPPPFVILPISSRSLGATSATSCSLTSSCHMSSVSLSVPGVTSNALTPQPLLSSCSVSYTTSTVSSTLPVISVNGDSASDISEKLPVTVPTSMDSVSVPTAEHLMSDDPGLNHSKDVAEPAGGTDELSATVGTLFIRQGNSVGGKRSATAFNRAWNSFGMLHAGFNTMFHIFQHLGVCDLLRAAAVCKTWHKLIKDSELWRSIGFRGCRVKNWQKAAVHFQRMNTQRLDFRGMLQNVNGGCAWLGMAENLPRLSALQHVDLGQCSARVLSVAAESFPNLQSVTAEIVAFNSSDSPSGSSCPEFDPTKLADLHELVCLKVRGVPGITLPTNSDGTKTLQGLGRLTQLQNLSLTTLRGIEGKDFSFIGSLSQLRVLELGNCLHWTKETFGNLATLVNLTNLRLECGGDTVDAGLGDALKKLTNLQHLELIRYFVADNLAIIFPVLSHLRTFFIWPELQENESQVGRQNSIILSAVSGMPFLQRLFWGITIDSQQSTTEDATPNAASRPATIPFLLRGPSSVDKRTLSTRRLTIQEIVLALSDRLPSTKIRVFQVPAQSHQINSQ